MTSSYFNVTLSFFQGIVEFESFWLQTLLLSVFRGENAERV